MTIQTEALSLLQESRAQLAYLGDDKHTHELVSCIDAYLAQPKEHAKVHQEQQKPFCTSIPQLQTFTGENPFPKEPEQKPVVGLRCKVIENCKSCQHSVGRLSCSLASRDFDSLERSSVPPEWCPLPLYTIPSQPKEQEPVGEAYLCDMCKTPFERHGKCPSCGHNVATKLPVYTSTPQRKPLTPLTNDFLQQNDYHLLHRFIETTGDDEGYDIGKDAIKRLAELGAVQSHGFGKYSATTFGHWVHERYWHQDPSLPLKTNADRDIEAAHGIKE